MQVYDEFSMFADNAAEAAQEMKRIDPAKADQLADELSNEKPKPVAEPPAQPAAEQPQPAADTPTPKSE